ncbi:MAG: ABC transporter substrate-binding protein [Betaproteobacteria bacterium]
MSSPRFYGPALLCAIVFAAGAFAQDEPIVVGAVVSESAAQYRQALLSWEEEINAAGGLLGRKVELALLDDGAQPSRTAAQYAELIRQGAALLVGPSGSAATLIAAAEAERARRVMVNAGGPARAVHRRSPRYLFQVVAPYSAYASGILELAREAQCSRLMILAREDGASSEMAEGAQALAKRTGPPESYAGSESSFAGAVEKARAAGVQAWIAFGEARDAADMVISFRRNGYAPPVFFASGSAQPRFRSFVGRDAEHTLGVVRYDARLATPGNAAFVRGFRARWKAAPEAAAAEAYAAATVLAEAVRRAGSLEQEKLRAMLSTMEADTVLGRYRVDPASGEQALIRPAVTQIVKGRAEIVWPASLRTAEPNLKCH